MQNHSPEMIAISENELKELLADAVRPGADTGSLAILTAMEISLNSWKVQIAMRLMPKLFIRRLKRRFEQDIAGGKAND